jgi:hypothetical protein
MSGEKLVVVDHIGGEQEEVAKEQFLSEKHAIGFEFHDCVELNHERGEEARSSVVLCHGYQ